MRAALVEKKTGLVVNVIEIDKKGDYKPGKDFRVVDLRDDDLVGPDWILKGSEFLPPAPPSREPSEPVEDNSELIAEIDNAMTLAELRRVLVKIVAPEIANERKMR